MGERRCRKTAPSSWRPRSRCWAHVPARADWSGAHVDLYGGDAFGIAPTTTSAAANTNAARNYPAFDAANLGAVNAAGVEEPHPSGGTFGAEIGYDKG